MRIRIPERKYLHFDRPFSGDIAFKAVSDTDQVAKWSFMPFLHIELKKIRVKRQKDGSLKREKKDRPIFYAAHRDAALYFYYAELMSNIYEVMLSELGIADCVTAFRKSRGMCNIHYALEVFREIQKQGHCDVFTFDVRSFFENLDHKILKRLWSKLLGMSSLPADHYAVYKSITHYSYVDRDAAFSALGIDPKKLRVFTRRHLCEAQEFRELIRETGLIQQHVDPSTGAWKSVGIPQGSPISALLSNLYMVEFDSAIAARVKQCGGMYRRYCDDIICVIPEGCGLKIDALIKSEISKLFLEIHPDKSTVHHFRCHEGSLVCEERKPVQYLGFLFDGKAVRLRTVALSRYYAKMRSGVRATDRNRKATDLESGVRTSLKTRALNRRYTYLGRRNFITYAHRAARIMSSAAIRKQIKPHLARFIAYKKMKEDWWLKRSEEGFASLRQWYLTKRGIVHL